MTGTNHAPWTLWNNISDGNREDDVEFTLELISELKSRYNIDEHRIYDATGHSNGSFMTHLLGMTNPSLFAAISPCSGVIIHSHASMYRLPNIRKNVNLPVWMFMGENDFGPGNGIPRPNSDTEKSIEFWKGINNLDPAVIPESKKNGRYNTLTYYSEDGLIPLVKYTWIDNFPHAIVPEQTWMIWDYYFSKFRRNTDGTINYNE